LIVRQTPKNFKAQNFHAQPGTPKIARPSQIYFSIPVNYCNAVAHLKIRGQKHRLL
jgi:hypothetical protein